MPIDGGKGRDVAKGVPECESLLIAAQNLPPIWCVVDRLINPWVVGKMTWDAFNDGRLHCTYVCVHASLTTKDVFEDCSHSVVGTACA